MKPRPQKKLNKPRFVVDINVSYIILKKRYGGYARFISSANLLKKQNASDDEIIKVANDKNYHIITHNTIDFENAPKRFNWLKVGVICVNLKEENYLDKFGRLLRTNSKHENYYNKLFILGNLTTTFKYSQLRLI